MLKKVDIHSNRQVARQVKKLYLSAFPKEEQIPWPVLYWNTKRKDLHFTAFIDGNLLCGFTIFATVENLCYIFFFAVEETLRGQGYGSRILADLQTEYGTLGLNIEPLDPAADNYEQRKMRFAFYGKNGFFDTEHNVWEVGGKFRILSTQKNLPMIQVQKAFSKLTAGLWHVKIRPSSGAQFPESHSTGGGHI